MLLHEEAMIKNLGSFEQVATSHGRFLIGDSLLDTASIPPLSQLRAATTSSSVPISQRPTAMMTLQVSIQVLFAVPWLLRCLALHLWNICGQMLQAELETLRGEREAERVQREAKRQRTLALEAQQEHQQRQMAEMIRLMQQQGWVIPQPLLAPPPPTLIPPHDSTPVRMNTNVLLSMLMLRAKASAIRRNLVMTYLCCLKCNLFYSVQYGSAATSNGSPRLHVGPSPLGGSAGSHSRLSHLGPSSWATCCGLCHSDFAFWTCEMNYVDFMLDWWTVYIGNVFCDNSAIYIRMCWYVVVIYTCDIYVWFSWKCKKQKINKFSRGFAECNDLNTRQS